MRAVILSILIALTSTGQAGGPRKEIRVWTARAIGTVLAEIGSDFESTTGYRLNVTTDIASGFARRMVDDDAADVIISGSASIEEWIRQERILPETRTDIARSGIGVEVRAGAPKPDISSVEAFQRTLLAANSIAYLKVGSGLHIEKVVERLGISDAIRSRVTRPESDIVSELVAQGKVDLGIVVITQILTTPGVAFVGPLPAELQSHVMFTAGIGAKSKAPDPAKQLIRFLTSASAKPVMLHQGMEPAF